MVSKTPKSFRLREIQNRKELFLKEHAELKRFEDREIPASVYYRHRGDRLESAIRSW
jgi:hypothetical protein